MKKKRKLLIILSLLILSLITLLGYLLSKWNDHWDLLEISYFKTFTIISFNLLFYFFMFSFNFELYKKCFNVVLFSSFLIWIIIFSLFYMGFINYNLYLWNFWDIVSFIAFSMVAPGLTLFTTHYIIKDTEKYSNSKIFGKYHIHEGFIGILLTIGAIPLFVLCLLIISQGIFWRELQIILALNILFLFLFLYFGGFFIFRDLYDIIQLKFIEVKEDKTHLKNQIPIFKEITQDNLHFFEHPRLKLYLFGMILTSFSINAIIYNINFLPMAIVNLNKVDSILIGFILSFIGGSLTGRDWLRLFKQFYPDIYKEIENMKKTIRIPE